jgi:hypothetical protein
MAIKVKSSLQTPIGMSFPNLILSICGVYNIQKNLAQATVYYYINRTAEHLKSENISCVFNVHEHPAQALYRSLKNKLVEQGVSLNDIEDC